MIIPFEKVIFKKCTKIHIITDKLSFVKITSDFSGIYYRARWGTILDCEETGEK